MKRASAACARQGRARTSGVISRWLRQPWMWRGFVALLVAWQGPAGWSPAAEPATAADVFGLPDGALTNDGALVIGGGGLLPEEVYETFVELAGGPKARLVLIPTAYPFTSLTHAKRRYGGWYDYDVQSLDFIDAKTREAADKESYIRPLRQATGVWLCGGAQGRLADIYRGTEVEEAIRDVVARGGVVGGTSAGASIMSEVMIRTGTAYRAELDRGFALIKHAVIDQHFYERGRQERLFGVLTEHPHLVGIGIDEGTAVVIRNNRIRAMGTGRVSICLMDNDKEDEGLEWICRMKDGDVAELVTSSHRPANAQPSFIEVRKVASK